MNFLAKYSIRHKINIIVTSVLCLLYIVVGIGVYLFQKNLELNRLNNQFMQETQNLSTIIQLNYSNQQKRLATGLRLFNHYLNQYGVITESSDSIDYETYNNETHEIIFVSIPKLKHNNKDLINNSSITDYIKKLSGVNTAIMQKTTEGYIIISSNLQNSEGKIITDIFIPNAADLVANIENGEVFTGKIKLLDFWFYIALQPIYTNGKVNGALLCATPEEYHYALKDFLANKRYISNGFAFVLNSEGTYLLHPKLQQTSVAQTKMFLELKKLDQNTSIATFNYIWPETDNGKNMTQYVKYIPQINEYAGIAYYNADIIKQLNKLKIVIVIAIFFLCLVTVFLTNYFANHIISRLLKSSKYLKRMAEGEIFEKIESDFTDEISNIALETNKLAELFNSRLLFINNLLQNTKNGPLSRGPKDTIGRQLEKLEIELQKSTVQNQERITEDEKNLWISKGMTMFIEILRFHNINRSEMTYNIISNLVNYLSANQGGLFFINDDDAENVFIEMEACYAYNKQRIIQKKIPTSSGLLGRVYHEKNSIYLTEIPQDYIKITSGLGNKSPEYLLIVPLIFNDVINGIIEIASFFPIQQHQIEFVERIAESISSTISGLKITEKTENLLKQSEDQSKLMRIQERELMKNLNEMRKLKAATDNKEIQMRGLFKAIDATSLIIEYSPHEKIINVNSKICEILQVTADELIDRYHHDISSFNPGNKDYQKFWNDLRNGVVRSIIETIHVNNKTIWLSETFTPVLDDENNVIKIINIGMDITETKKLEKQLRTQEREIGKQEIKLNEKENQIQLKQITLAEKETEFNDLSNALNKSVFKLELSTKGTILTSNAFFALKAGHTIDKLINREFSEFLSVDTISVLENALKLVTTGNDFKGNIQFKTRFNQVLHININLFPLRNKDGQITKILLLGTDISTFITSS